MSLYHQLETVEIPTIGQFKMSPMQDEVERPPPMQGFAPPASLRLGQDEQPDPFITRREQPAQVQAPLQVLDVSGRFFGNGQETKQKRFVLENTEEEE
jgi:hypothetical protein